MEPFVPTIKTVKTFSRQNISNSISKTMLQIYKSVFLIEKKFAYNQHVTKNQLQDVLYLFGRKL